MPRFIVEVSLSLTPNNNRPFMLVVNKYRTCLIVLIVLCWFKLH